jgi:hypothetical protein
MAIFEETEKALIKKLFKLDISSSGFKQPLVVALSKKI